MSTSTISPQALSEKAKEEGGPTKGSDSAKMQSQITKEMNAEAVKKEVEPKLAADDPIKQEEAQKVQSLEQKAMGGQRPPTDSLSAQPQSAAAITEVRRHCYTVDWKLLTAVQQKSGKERNEEGAAHDSIDKSPASEKPTGQTGTTSNRNPDDDIDATRRIIDQSEQSRLDREHNFEVVINQVKPKIDTAPETVTHADANLLHSREARAHGGVERGSITARAMSIANKNDINAQLMKDHEEGVKNMKAKIENDRKSVGKEEADHLHRLDQKLYGQTKKGSIVAEAQHIAATEGSAA